LTPTSTGADDHLEPEKELEIMEEFGWTEENLEEVERYSKKAGEEN